LKKPKDNTKYSVITPSMCREAQQPIPRWQWNIRGKYEGEIINRYLLEGYSNIWHLPSPIF